MKLIYFTVLLLFSFALSAQELVETDTSVPSRNTSFKLYPNPVYDAIVYINTASNGTKDIVVYDVFGETVLTERISTNSLNVSRLVPGVYVLQVTENSTTMSRKLVVK